MCASDGETAILIDGETGRMFVSKITVTAIQRFMRRFRLYELSHRIDSLIDRNISINDIRNFKKKKKKRILGTANEIKFYDLKEYFSISKDQ